MQAFKDSPEYKLQDILLNALDVGGSDFPLPKRSIKETNNYDNKRWTHYFKIRDVIDWIYNNLEINIETSPSWIRAYIIQKHNTTKLKEINMEQVEIANLPPLLQWAVKSHLRINWNRKPNTSEIFNFMITLARECSLPNIPTLDKNNVLNFPEKANDRKSLSNKFWQATVKMIKPDN